MMPRQAIRVFLSYSHEDRPVFDAVRRALVALDIGVSADTDLAPGKGFTEQIQTKISHSHLFIPILTPASHARGWVHQEIGFAVAMKVPCVPVCIGQLADGMIKMAQALVVREDLADLTEKLATVDFSDLVDQAGRLWAPPGDLADEPEVRARKIEEYADSALRTIGPSHVRVSGGLTSFSLPDERVEHPVWLARYGSHPRGAFSLQAFRAERRALQRHAMAAGVSMVLNLGIDLDTSYGAGATRTRLSILLQFLESLTVPDSAVTIATVDEQLPHVSLAVGDWFFAESRAARPIRGVLHTAFVAHAPTVSRRIQEFDDEVASLLAEQRVTAAGSRSRAMDEIRARIRTLPPHPAWAGASL